MVKKIFFFVLTCLLVTSIFSALGSDESKLIGTYAIGQYPTVGRISSNGTYSAVGTQKGVFLFEKTSELLWKDESIGSVNTLVITPDNKYLVVKAGSTYVYTIVKGQRISNFDFSDNKEQKIEDKVYYDIFNEIGFLDYFYKSGPQWYKKSYDPLVIRDSKMGVIYVASGSLYKFDEVNDKNGQPAMAVAMNSYSSFYQYNGKVYIHSLVKKLDIPEEEKIKFNGIISKYFLIATDKGVYMYDINGDRKWSKDIEGIDTCFISEYSPYILVKKPYDIIILDQQGNMKFQYNFPEKLRMYGIRSTYISAVSEKGTIYFFDIKDKPETTRTDTNTVVQDKTEISKGDTIATPIEEANDTTQHNFPTQETKNTPGFEMPTILGGSLIAAYILNKRRK